MTALHTFLWGKDIDPIIKPVWDARVPDGPRSHRGEELVVQDLVPLSESSERYDQLPYILLGSPARSISNVFGDMLATSWWMNAGHMYFSAYDGDTPRVLVHSKCDTYRIIPAIMIAAILRPDEDDLQVASAQLIAAGARPATVDWEAVNVIRRHIDKRGISAAAFDRAFPETR